MRVTSSCFCFVMAAAAISACAQHGELVLTPHTSQISGHTPPLRVRVESRRHGGRSHPVNPNFPPPTVLNGANGSYCYLTNGGPDNGGPIQPGWAPQYDCWMNQNDTIDFGELQQTPMAGHGPGNYCGPVTYDVRYVSSAGPKVLSFSGVPLEQGLGNWNCERPRRRPGKTSKIGATN